jgi:hypothetical protein
MPTTTTNYSWSKPVVGADTDAWGGYLNANLDALDTLLSGVTEAEFTVLNGTADYLNVTTIGTTEASRAAVTDANGDILFSEELKAKSYNETYLALTSTSNVVALDCETGNSFSHTLTESTAFTFSNPPASGTSYTMSIEIKQDASASGFTAGWPIAVQWPDSTAPTLTDLANSVDVFVFTTRDGGTTWLGFTASQNY